MTNCLQLIAKIDERDQSAILSRLDELQAQGMPAKRAQVQAAIDVLAQLKRDEAGDIKASPQRDITETPEFKSWFGNSKVVDENGKPLVVYHGTRSEFSSFDPNRMGRGSGTPAGAFGFFFDADYESAARYGKYNVMEVYLSMRNPLRVDAGGSPTHAYYDHNVYEDGYTEQAERDGHDGIIVSNNAGKKMFVVFNPEQIKSATSNNGQFDPTSPDIRKSTDREDAPMRLSLGGGQQRQAAKAWAKKVRDQFPRNPMNGAQSVIMLSEEDMVIFELDDSVTKPGAVEVKWFQAYPKRNGNGTKGMQELQRLAAEDGISLTLFPWNKGQVSQSALTKFYKKNGFAPLSKGGKDMVWSPSSETKFSPSRLYTETPEFKKWFGGSKVVNESGEPMVAYHGTVVRPDTDRVKNMGDIQAFDRMFTTKFRAPSLDTVGSWFSTNPGDGGAEMYTGGGPGAAIYPVYLSIKNPHVTTFYLMARRARMLANGVDDDRPIRRPEVDAYRKWLETMDKDGIKIEGSGREGSTEFDNQIAWIALEPEQIKSAIGNSGAFDSTNPDIRKSLPRPQFYSQLQRVIDEVPERIATMAAPQWKLWLDANGPKLGVKKDEIEWSGLKDYLDLQGKAKLSKADLSAYLDDSGVQVEETVLSNGGLSAAEVQEVNELRDLYRRHEEGQEGVFDAGDFDRLQELEQYKAGSNNITKYAKYTVEGGSNYRELLLTLPERTPSKLSATEKSRLAELEDLSRYKELTASEEKEYDLLSSRQDANDSSRTDSSYRSSHWDQPNILAHVRIDDRTDADGQSVLFVNEIQSDWAQEARKRGFVKSYRAEDVAELDASDPTAQRPDLFWYFKTPDNILQIPKSEHPTQDGARNYIVNEKKINSGGVPSAPFVANTKSWVALALKRVMLAAVEGGYEKVAFISGEQAADLYDLSKEVRRIAWTPDSAADRIVSISPTAGNEIEFRVRPDGTITSISELRALGNEFDGKNIADVVGKDMADKIMLERRGDLSGDGLKVGGSGMRTFYDEIVPQVASELLKKLGGKMEAIEFGKPTGEWGVYDATEEESQGLYSRHATRQEAERAAEDFDGGVEVRQNVDAMQQAGFSISPKLRDTIGQGLPLFSRSRSPLGFSSSLADALAESKTGAAPAQGWKDAIKGLINKGAVKADEVEWSGINDWLDLQGQPQRVYESGFGLVEEFAGPDGSWQQVDDLGMHYRTRAEAEAAVTDEMKSYAEKLGKENDTQGRVAVKAFDDNQLHFGKMVTPKITKEQIAQYLRDGGVRVEETMLGGNPPPYADWADANPRYDDLSPDDRQEKYDEYIRSIGASKYGQYQLPGGENYREVLLTLPDKAAAARLQRFSEIDDEIHTASPERFKELYAERDALARQTSQRYQSSHWDQPNVLAHIRLNDRTDADGNKVLFVEEIQSDWGQAGKKKGFASKDTSGWRVQGTDENDPSEVEVLNAQGRRVWQGTANGTDRQIIERAAQGGIPAAPFVTKTEGWLNLALKRVMVMAAEGGYDKVAFINGDQSADRYDLSKQIGSIDYNKNPSSSGKYYVEARKPDGYVVLHGGFTSDELESRVGKEIANKIVSGEGDTIDRETTRLSGLDLKVGGEGMKAFYDQIVPMALKKLLPKVGGGRVSNFVFNQESAVRSDDFDGDSEGTAFVDGAKEQIGFDVTDAMRNKVAEGLPLFSRSRQTDTPEFKAWFGDSQVVDAQGAPLVMYHGTTNFEGNEFKPSKRVNRSGNVDGYYFASRIGRAESFLEDWNTGETKEGAEIIPVYLSIKNPFTPRKSPVSQKMLDAYREELVRTNPHLAPNNNWFDGKVENFKDSKDVNASALNNNGRAYQRVLTAGGYDGMIDGGDWIAFNSTQIKSAIGNSGSFDSANPDISKSNERQTDTPEFKAWFGDSKIVDADGQPLVVYTGTSKDVDFKAFKIPKNGAWFTTDKFTASSYALENDSKTIKTENYRDFREVNTASRVIPAYLRIEKLYTPTYDEMTAMIRATNYKREQGNLFERVRRDGFDGVDMGGGVYVVLDEPAQIKSALGNNGQFDPGKGDISKSTQRQTDTPQFKRWFGDSKVVDESGEPLVVYHGSGLSFSEFMSFRGKMIYFAKDKNTAESYAESADENQRSQGNYDDDIGRDSEDGGAAIYPVYLSIQNPFDPDNVTHLAKLPKAIAGEIKRTKGDYDAIEQYQGDIEAAGFDGVYVREHSYQDAADERDIAVFSPTQIKSAIGNDGTFDPANPDITKSTGRTSTGADWDSPSASKFDDLVYKLQDKQVDLKRVVASIQDASGAIADDLNVYLQEELYHGRAAKRTEDFVNMELAPLVEQMKTNGLEIADVEEYLHARHAPEANQVIAQRNPGVANLQDGGSGMLTQDALNYMASLTPEMRQKLDAAAAKVDAIIAQTNQLYVDYELESKDKIDGWGKMFQHYIPLQREDKDGSPGLGQGFSIKGKEVKGRTGSTRKVVDILANIAIRREKAIVRGEKNRVSQALVGLAQANPNQDFWQVDIVPSERVFNPATGLVEDRTDPLYKSRDNAVIAKIKDANGAVREHAVLFNEEDPRALRMAQALKNLDATALEGVLGVSAKVSRYFAAVNTQWNPIFGIVNLVRDVQGAILNLSSTPLKGDEAKIARNTASALAGIYADTRAARQGKSPSSAWALLWDEFQTVGGQTGFRDLYKTSADRAEAIQKALNPDAWMDSKLGKIFTANGALKVPLSQATKGASWLFGWLSDYNLAMENGVRLAAYKAGLERGMSKEQAASVAKNLTVNFNRKGQTSQHAGALYAFFNASVQGTARLGQTLFVMEPGKPKTMRLSPFGKKVVSGGLLLGSMQALALAAAGFSEDDPPEFARERGLIIPLPDKKYLTIPMPLGFHVIPSIGRISTEFVLSGFKDPHKRALSLASLFAETFNPIGNAGLSMQTLAPTALDPLVALTENRDWTGRPIARESSNKAIPGHALGRDTATTLAKVLSEGVNSLSGGNKYTSGVFSPTPDQIDYLIGQLTGGVGRELSKVEQTVLSTARGEALPPYKVPLVGRFIGDAKSQASEGGAFYATTERLNRLETEIKGLQKDGKAAEAAELRRNSSEAYLITMANQAERQIQKLRNEKRELIKAGAPRERVKEIEDRVTAVMARLNRASESLKEKAQ